MFHSWPSSCPLITLEIKSRKLLPFSPGPFNIQHQRPENEKKKKEVINTHLNQR